MAADPPFPSVADFPDDLVCAVVADAARDVRRVALFLDGVGFRAAPERPVRMPARFLLQLAAALRLLGWEAQGFALHREDGLPDAREAILDAFRSLADPDADPTDFCVRVTGLAAERFAWTAARDLGADVSVGEAEDEVVLDALADFLWAHRPR